jgi:hypothetical protein
MDDGVDFTFDDIDLNVNRLFNDTADTSNLFSRAGKEEEFKSPSAIYATTNANNANNIAKNNANISNIFNANNAINAISANSSTNNANKPAPTANNANANVATSNSANYKNSFASTKNASNISAKNNANDILPPVDSFSSSSSDVSSLAPSRPPTVATTSIPRPQGDSSSSEVDDTVPNDRDEFDLDDGDVDIKFSHQTHKENIERDINNDLYSQFGELTTQITEYKSRYLKMIEKNKATYKSVAGLKTANNDLEEQIMDLKFQLNQSENASSEKNGMFRRRRGRCASFIACCCQSRSSRPPYICSNPFYIPFHS